MTDLRTAAQQALWALELDAYGEPARAERDAAIDDLRAALAEPEAEPVAWSHNLIDNNIIQHRPADLGRHPDRWTPLYTTPPSREWQSLTDEEIARILGRGDVAERTDRGAWVVLPYGLARAIEAALKEKNT